MKLYIARSRNSYLIDDTYAHITVKTRLSHLHNSFFTLLYYTHFPSFYRALLRPIHQPSLYAFPYPPPSLSLSAPPPSTIAAARRTFPSA